MKQMHEGGKTMIIVTTDTIPGKTITETKGMASASIVQSRNIGKDILSGLKSIVGGELASYTEMIEDSKRDVIRKLEEQAREMGGNAIIGFRFAYASGQTISELIGYGTVVEVQ